MPVIKRDKLPENHPFKHGLIVFGQKRPTASMTPSTTGESTSSGQLPNEEKKHQNLNEKAGPLFEK